MAKKRYVAFLRAINVGGRTVKMQELRTIFEALGLEDVQTFIASGNVIFETAAKGGREMERRIENHLHKSLGYEVATFIRPAGVLETVSTHPAVADAGDAGGATTYVIFLREPPDVRETTGLLDMQTASDDLHVNGREVFWLCRRSIRESTVSGARIEKLLDSPVTIRNINTVTRLSAKFGARA